MDCGKTWRGGDGRLFSDSHGWPNGVHMFYIIILTEFTADFIDLQPPMEPTSSISPLAPFPLEPPDEYRSRAPEFYGFVAWTSTTIAFVLYLLWALLPDDYIAWLGVEWYPSR